METPDESLPDRIPDDMGLAFSVGTMGSSIYHFIKGSTSGAAGNRFAAGIQAARVNAPRTGGSFAVWWGVCSALECALASARKKEDRWNTIISGFATGGLLRLRCGLPSAAAWAVATGVLFAAIEGVDIMLERDSSTLPKMVAKYPSIVSNIGSDLVSDSN